MTATLFETRADAERRRREEANEWHAAALSLAASHRTRAAVLALACDEHRAGPGAYCWGSPESGVRGLCTERYDRGVIAAADVGARASVLRGGDGLGHAHAASWGPRSRAVDDLARGDGSPDLVRDDPQAKLDRRHKNRHPVHPVREARA